MLMLMMMVILLKAKTLDARIHLQTFKLNISKAKMCSED